MNSPSPPRVLVVFNTATIYGMERAVIETFDSLRPDVAPEFLISQIVRRNNLTVWREIQRRGFECRFFSDDKSWPKIGRPRSLRHGWQLIRAIFRGNWDVLKS